MKILVLGGGQLLAEFRDAGHHVRALLPPGQVSHPDDNGLDFYADPFAARQEILRTVSHFGPEFIFQGDHSGPLIHTGLETATVPKAWYAVDAHLHGRWYPHYAPVFDRVFCAQLNQMENLRRWQPEISWLPLYCGREVEPVPWNERRFDISFVGKFDERLNPERKHFFDDLLSAGVRVHVVSGEWAPVYRDSKVVINHSVADDLNLRFFEAPGCGALLITDMLTHSMEDILTPGSDYFTYPRGDARSCAENVRWVFNHEHEAAEMAECARCKIRSAHMERHRAVTVLDWVVDFRNDGDKMAGGEREAHLAWAFDTVAQLDLPQALTDWYGRESLAHARNAHRAGDRSGYSAVLCADDALRRNDIAEAGLLLASVRDTLPEERLELRKSKLMILHEFAQGNRSRAEHLVQLALSNFKEDRELAAMFAAITGERGPEAESRGT
jgi:hypothetical protein